MTYKGIEPVYMPLTGIATIALDEIIFSKQQAIDRCLRYLSSDTVCYLFDGEDDRKLLERQKEHWEPLLQWMKDDFGIEVARPEHMLSIAENSPVTLRKIERCVCPGSPYTAPVSGTRLRQPSLLPQTLCKKKPFVSPRSQDSCLTLVSLFCFGCAGCCGRWTPSRWPPR